MFSHTTHRLFFIIIIFGNDFQVYFEFGAMAHTQQASL